MVCSMAAPTALELVSVARMSGMAGLGKVARAVSVSLGSLFQILWFAGKGVVECFHDVRNLWKETVVVVYQADKLLKSFDSGGRGDCEAKDGC